MTIRIVVVFILLFILTGCMPRLSVRTEYITEESFASYYVDTPDPCLDHFRPGQRLIISWTLSEQELQQGNTFLHIKIRFRNRTEKIIYTPIEKARSYLIYNLTENCFYETEGILTYKVEIIQNSQIIDCWQHPLWAELIELNKE